MAGLTQAGMFMCNGCRDKFTVRTRNGFRAFAYPASQKVVGHSPDGREPMSALQLSRMLDITYKSAWLMCHRVREAMTPTTRGPIGGERKTVEVDETEIGGKKRWRAYAEERAEEAQSLHHG